ncbi:MAG: hypothetical protein K2J24_06930, partial [Muribaculaceae bacterium]|nr:hypothetical protein [Muribaculaceae bacterium]
KHIYLSMWKGYADKTRTAYNPALAKSLKSNYQLMHTTGHCDMKSIEKLIEVLLPNAIIPIHTDQPKAFAERFSTQCPVILLNDGESINLIHNSIVK